MNSTLLNFFGKAAAICLVSSLACTTLLRSSDEPPKFVEAATESATALEQKTVDLQDGSLVQLNRTSSVKIDLGPSERHIRLRGEARFQVKPGDSRPFIVGTPHARLRVLGTVFNVRAEQDRTAITVIEGRVEVTGLNTSPVPMTAFAAPLKRVILTAGQGVTISRDGRIALDDGPTVAQVNAWPLHEVRFADSRLSDVLIAFNHFAHHPILTKDPGIGEMLITGHFNAYDRESLITYLRNFEDIDAIDLPDGSQELLRR